MQSIEFRVFHHDPEWTEEGGSSFAAIDVMVDGQRLLDLVYQAELPYALAEQREREAEMAPDPMPLLAGDYMCLPSGYGWPSRHLLDEPMDLPHQQRQDGETMLLICTCGIMECWALMARIQIGETTVRWSGFRNTYRDWDLSALDFTFSRQQYEEALTATQT